MVVMVAGLLHGFAALLDGHVEVQCLHLHLGLESEVLLLELMLGLEGLEVLLLDLVELLLQTFLLVLGIELPIAGC